MLNIRTKWDNVCTIEWEVTGFGGGISEYEISALRITLCIELNRFHKRYIVFKVQVKPLLKNAFFIEFNEETFLTAQKSCLAV